MHCTMHKTWHYFYIWGRNPRWPTTPKNTFFRFSVDTSMMDVASPSISLLTAAASSSSSSATAAAAAVNLSCRRLAVVVWKAGRRMAAAAASLVSFFCRKSVTLRSNSVRRRVWVAAGRRGGPTPPRGLPVAKGLKTRSLFCWCTQCVHLYCT